jgi:Zn-dependent M28 family amino/carboxypeptidase
LLFIAFSGEENGLLGSRFFVNYQPMVPLEKIVSMFNFDMVGRNEPELLWIGGAFYSDDLRKIIERANTEVGFELLYNVGLLNFASDQAPFLKKEIPSAFFFSGLHDDYHTPKDDYDKIDYDKLSKVVRLGFLAIESLANSDFKPAYKELSIEERKSLVDISMQKQKKYRTIKNIESEEIEK